METRAPEHDGDVNPDLIVDLDFDEDDVDGGVMIEDEFSDEDLKVLVGGEDVVDKNDVIENDVLRQASCEEEVDEPRYMKPGTIPFVKLEKTHKNVVADLGGDLREEAEWAEANRPKIRAHCESGPRPCPFLLCRYHLYLEIKDTGALKINFPEMDPMEIPASCALDIAERGGLSLEDVGFISRMTRERIRQIAAYAASRIHETFKDPNRKVGGEYVSTWSASEDKDQRRAMTKGIRLSDDEEDEGLTAEEAAKLGIFFAEEDEDGSGDLDLNFEL
ncbi:hypothetical protein HOG17_01805 [Candidatus Peregrinibacteria bacterium]|jgi:hypothetical protein|nr:hypothetical protein [Candidatus Peregrinibacteria bacterium]MBT4148092.1 hypothetical protein [Candidatus Peregrinibacteria bacterium]MBT4365856.1 hypothetical protein [Candidatus Peregrinibacteria bacterium]MBT4456454.1 hypothetical protein [Candidatus Peregrinibacteria bacterium]